MSDLLNFFLLIGLVVILIIIIMVKASAHRRARLEHIKEERLIRQIKAEQEAANPRAIKSKPPPGIPERRSGKDRRSGIDRRQHVRFSEDRRKGPGRRAEDRVWSGKEFPHHDGK